MSLTAQQIKRVLNEVKDVNEDFFSLRTVIEPTDRVDLYNFVMLPNDGPMTHLPLIGEMIIPNEYPTKPPVLHLFTKTFRYNVDVYRSLCNDDTRSSMCFDILRPKAKGGAWEPTMPLSCLFASLMTAVVSVHVLQEGGNEISEFVSMEKMKDINKAVEDALRKYGSRIKTLPQPPLVKATPILGAHEFKFEFQFGQVEFPIGLDKTYTSQPFYLQTGHPFTRSMFLDLDDLHGGVVFSIVLSNKRGTDLTGNKKDTVLVRNGVTGTSARKRIDKAIRWNYHGKPLLEKGLQLCITVTESEFTLSYKSRETCGDYVIHGDTYVSKLDKNSIGDVAGKPFYLNLYVKYKSGNSNGSLKVLDHNGCGYVHTGGLTTKNVSVSSKPPIFVKLATSKETAVELAKLVTKTFPSGHHPQFFMYNTKKGYKDPPHMTLVFNRDFDKAKYKNAIDTFFRPIEGEQFTFKVTHMAVDASCVCLITETPTFVPEEALPNKIFHLTMGLSGKPPVYSNELIARLFDKTMSGDDFNKDEYLHKFDTPIEFKGTLTLHT